MGEKFNYFQQYVNELERQRVETAHEEHILEFRAMCAKMIEDAKAQIKRECMEEMQQQEKKHSPAKQSKINVRLDIKDIERQVRAAFKKAFK